MIWTLSIYSLLISVTLIISVYYNYKFGRALIRMEDALDDSIEKLDDRYNSIAKILEIPLFSDSPQVRQVVADIKECQRSILFVANEIGRLEESFDGEEENS